MLKLIKKNYKNLISIVILLLSVVVLVQMRSQLSEVKLVKPLLLIPAFILTSAFLVLNGLMTMILVGSFGLKLGIIESISLSVTNTFGNLVTPFRGGLVSNAIYLKNKYKFNFSNYVAMMSATYVVVFWVASFAGLISCVFIGIVYGLFSWPIFFVFSMGTIMLGMVMFFSPKVNDTTIPILNKVSFVINKWNSISKNRKLIGEIILLNLLNTMLMVGTSYFEFQAIGLSVSIEKLIFLSVFSIYSLFLSITPANLGVKEAFAVYSGLAVGIMASNVIMVSLVDRMLNVLIVLSLFLPASYILLRRTKTKIS